MCNLASVNLAAFVEEGQGDNKQPTYDFQKLCEVRRASTCCGARPPRSVPFADPVLLLAGDQDRDAQPEQGHRHQLLPGQGGPQLQHAPQVRGQGGCTPLPSPRFLP